MYNGQFHLNFLKSSTHRDLLEVKKAPELDNKDRIKSTWCQTNPDELAHYTIYNNYEDVVSVVTAQRMDGFYGQLNAMNQIDFIAK